MTLCSVFGKKNWKEGRWEGQNKDGRVEVSWRKEVKTNKKVVRQEYSGREVGRGQLSNRIANFRVFSAILRYLTNGGFATLKLSIELIKRCWSLEIDCRYVDPHYCGAITKQGQFHSEIVPSRNIVIVVHVVHFTV